MESPSHSASYEALQAENQLLRERLEGAEQLADGYKERLGIYEVHQARLKADLSRVEHELAQLKRLLFGTRSERFVPEGGPEQLPLFESAPAEQSPTGPRQTVTYTRERRKPVRQVLPSHLPREVITIEPEGVDPSKLKKIGEEITETLDYRPARLVVIRRVRPKYVDPKDDTRGVLIGALPVRPVEKGLAEPGLLAHVVVEKYVDHLPLYRQLQRFTRQGITLSDSTLADWTRQTSELLVPFYEALRQQVLASGYIQADETPIPVQDADKKGATHRGYYWVYHAPLSGLVVIDYQRGRSRDGPAQFLSGFEGALQTDGYTAYEVFDAAPGVTTYGCWAHARRYFYEAREDVSEEVSTHVLSEIGKLHAVERVLREGGAEERRRRRQEEAVPVLEGLKAYLDGQTALPKSAWGKAVSYTLTRWAKLTRYVEDGRIEIDNNLVENAIRPIALGRKNYLFAGSHDAAERAAVVYSLLGTCKRHEVNPEAWLADVLARIPTHPMKQIEELLPHHWKSVKG